MMKVKRLVVSALPWVCDRMHWLTWHRPWLWLPIPNVWCPFAYWSHQLDQRWGTEVWKAPE